MRPASKIFQIGFNRCGTRTLHRYLRANGLKSVHWHKGKLAARIFENLRLGTDLLDGYQDFQVFTDMECLNATQFLEAYKLYPQLAAQYPDAIFILNTREPEAWIRSRFALGDGKYAALHKAYLQIDDDRALADHWRNEWDRHLDSVTQFFANEAHRFFVCQIETDLPRILDDMLPELTLDHSHYAVLR